MNIKQSILDKRQEAINTLDTIPSGAPFIFDERKAAAQAVVKVCNEFLAQLD